MFSTNGFWRGFSASNFLGGECAISDFIEFSLVLIHFLFILQLYRMLKEFVISSSRVGWCLLVRFLLFLGDLVVGLRL